MNKRSVRKFWAAYSLVLGVSIAPFAASTAKAQAATTTTTPTTTTPAEPQKLEKFEVTGSRIKRLDYESPAPVQAYSAQQIEEKGYSTIGEFVQSLPFNTGSANSIYQTASFTRGAATANPRGLGANRFLVLINGRRAITYGLTNSNNQSVFDFNSIPAAAVESIEYLKDGASAIYGSDAITGVLNIKLKKNYSGLATEAYYGNTVGHDTGRKEFRVLAGTGVGKTSAVFAFNYQSSASNFIHDYGINTTDYSYLGLNKGSNLNSSNNFPANINLSAAQAAASTVPGLSSGLYVLTGGVPTANPTIAGFSKVGVIPNENRYNFAQTYQLYPAYDNMGGYASIKHEFNDNLSAFGEVTFTDDNTYYAFTPSVISSLTEGLTLPANNPYNPFGVTLNNFLYRTNFGPVRKFDTESFGANFLGGLRGTVLDRWNFETAVSYGFSTVRTTARNQIRASALQALLNGTTRSTAINPFGPSDNQTIVNNLFTISNGSNRVEAEGFDASVDGKLFEVPGGEVGIAVGVEWREDSLVTNPDTAAYVGSGGGLPLSGKRTVQSIYTELSVPIFKSLELQFAGRHEQYSDFGNTTKPKVAAAYRFPDNDIANVKIRASYSEAFKAPDLGRLYSSQTIAFSSTVLQDPLRPQDPPSQLRIITGGNPNLKPEEAEVKYAGVVIEIPKVKDLSFSVDYFDIKIDKIIIVPSTNFLLSARGIAQFPNAIVRDGPGGPIQYISAVPANNDLAFQTYKGFDMGLKYTLRNTSFGTFNTEIDMTRITAIGTDSGLGGGYFDNIGLYNNPKWRGNGSVSWRYKDWSAAVAVDWIGAYFNDGYTVDGWGENPYTLVNPSITYRGFWNMAITLGANNVFDTRPPANGRETSLMDQNTYGAGALGQFLYIRVRKEF
ncbi:MAG: hypothetical protein JWM32_2300 [Verrucomicrobia bacterium]|nr:hypothetical protein [Verrucomicrobiota bacterium]